jgi:hypothetical protein
LEASLGEHNKALSQKKCEGILYIFLKIKHNKICKAERSHQLQGRGCLWEGRKEMFHYLKLTIFSGALYRLILYSLLFCTLI